jgi:hypothetical protein
LDTINYIMYIIIAALLSLCVLSIYIFINESAITGNVKRNLTSEYDYAHFSAVDHSNYLFTPSLLLCHPQRFTLNAGESIWIPRKWWHWVRTQGPSTAVNFWMPLTIGSSQIPFMITDVKQPPELLNAIESVTNTRESWNSRIDIIVPKDKISNDNEYVITLEGYIPNKRFDKLNSKILEVAKHHANIPPGAELNVWISEGYHDTGLHYDDKDGILTVLSGKKRINFVSTYRYILFKTIRYCSSLG